MLKRLHEFMYTPKEWRELYHRERKHKPCDSDGEPINRAYDELPPARDLRYLHRTQHEMPWQLGSHEFTRVRIPTFIDYEEPSLAQLIEYFNTLGPTPITHRERGCLLEVVVARELTKWFNSITYHLTRDTPHNSLPNSRWLLPDGRCVTLPGWHPLGYKHSFYNDKNLMFPHCWRTSPTPR